MDIKMPTTRRMSSAGSANLPAQVKNESRPATQSRPTVDSRELPQGGDSQIDSTTNLISDFIAPSPQTMALLTDARLTSILSEASKSLAPDGVTEDPTDRYAASVIETHLVARRQLNKLTNSLLKT